MPTVSVTNTAQAIRDIADSLRDRAKRLDDLASEMMETGNVTLAANAVNMASTTPDFDYLILRAIQAVASVGSVDLQLKSSDLGLPKHHGVS